MKPCLVAIVSALALAGCGGRDRTVEDVPAAFRDVQHRLGVINRQMDRIPESPDSAFEVPPDLQSRFVKDGLFDPKVRAWGWRIVRAQETLNRRATPIFIAITTNELHPMRAGLSDIRAEGAVANDFATLMKDYGRAVFEWVSAEGRSTAEVGDDMVIVRGALRAHERFLADAEDGAFPTDEDAEAAYAARIVPIMQALRDAQARRLTVRASAEDAVENLNAARSALGDYLDENGETRELAALLAKDDPRGLFGYFADKAAR